MTLRQWLTMRGMSQQEFARRSGINPTTVNTAYHGKPVSKRVSDAIAAVTAGAVHLQIEERARGPRWMIGRNLAIIALKIEGFTDLEISEEFGFRDTHYPSKIVSRYRQKYARELQWISQN